MVGPLALNLSMGTARIFSKGGSYFMGKEEQLENMLSNLLLSSLKPL
jgi:hypothetical protein